MKPFSTSAIAEEEKKDSTAKVLARRAFFAKMGGAAAVAALATSCQKNLADYPASNVAALSADGLATGSGDVAILNYAYLLEQLEAAFYMMVTDMFFDGASPSEKQLIRDVRDHETAHREFFKNALGSDAIPEVKFDFSSVNFSSRSSVLQQSKTFEDLGVSAYNGIAYAIQNPDYLLAAGKIVSVEARHAAYFRDLIQPGSFAGSDVVNNMGLDVANPPRIVLAAASPFIVTKLNFNTLPG